MAYLNDIPKYAFGTAYDLIRDDADESELEEEREEGEADEELKAKKEEETKRRQHNNNNNNNNNSNNINNDNNNISNNNISNNNHGNNNLIVDDSKQSKKMKNRHRNKQRRLREGELKELILQAIRMGCRHFDCAPLYGTQPVVGAALSEAIKMPTIATSSSGGGGGSSLRGGPSPTPSLSSVPRQHLFITSKLPPNMMRGTNILRSIERTLGELQLTYLDLFLIHAPFSTKHVADDNYYPVDDQGNLLLDDQNDGLLERAWLTLVDLKRRGFTRYIGLSNVNLEQLVRLNNLHHVDVVQNEYHIYNQDRELFDYCEEIDVHYEAYAAFGSPKRAKQSQKPCFMDDPVVNRVARLNRLSIAQVNIQWIHQQPLSYVIKCDNVRQLEENLRAIYCRSVSMNDMIDMDSLNRNIRLYLFDEHKGIEQHTEYPFKVNPSENRNNNNYNNIINNIYIDNHNKEEGEEQQQHYGPSVQPRFMMCPLSSSHRTSTSNIPPSISICTSNQLETATTTLKATTTTSYNHRPPATAPPIVTGPVSSTICTTSLLQLQGSSHLNQESNESSAESITPTATRSPSLTTTTAANTILVDHEYQKTLSHLLEQLQQHNSAATGRGCLRKSAPNNTNK